MFAHRITLIRLLGIDVKVDASWIFLVILVVWSLAEGAFPHYYPDLDPATYWWMGVLGALGLFASVVLHEFGHAVVARKYGIPIDDITLFIFGGVANMKKEPSHAKDEFLMAIAGPLVSVMLALIFRGIHTLFRPEEGILPLLEVIGYLGWLNMILAIFNMVPAFPLDGGRVFRSMLWAIKGDLRWATRIASAMGSSFGFILMALGLFAFISGQIIAGAWWFMIGLFVRGASQASYRQILVKGALEGEPIGRFMKTDVVAVPARTSVRGFVENYVYTYHHKLYPVIDEGHLQGCVSARSVKSISPEDWERYPVSEILDALSDENTVASDEGAVEVLNRMNQTGNARLLVVDHGHLVGIITLKDLLEFIALRLELEG